MDEDTLLISYGQILTKLVPSAFRHRPETVDLRVAVAHPLHMLLHGGRQQTNRQRLPLPHEPL